MERHEKPKEEESAGPEESFEKGEKYKCDPFRQRPDPSQPTAAIVTPINRHNTAVERVISQDVSKVRDLAFTTHDRP